MDLDQMRTVRIPLYGHARPEGVLYDAKQGLVYWTDSILGFIAVAAMNGSSVDIIKSYPPASGKAIFL